MRRGTKWVWNGVDFKFRCQYSNWFVRALITIGLFGGASMVGVGFLFLGGGAVATASVIAAWIGIPVTALGWLLVGVGTLAGAIGYFAEKIYEDACEPKGIFVYFRAQVRWARWTWGAMPPVRIKPTKVACVDRK